MKNLLLKLLRALPFSFYKAFVKLPPLGVFYHMISDEPHAEIIHLYPFKSPKMLEADVVFLKKNFNLVTYDQIVNKTAPPNSLILTFDDGFREFKTVIWPILKKHDIPFIFFLATDFLDNKELFYRNLASLTKDKLIKLDEVKSAELLKAVNVSWQLNLKNKKELEDCVQKTSYAEKGRLVDIAYKMGIEPNYYLDRYEPFLTSEEVKEMAAEGVVFGGHSKTHRHLSTCSPIELDEEIAGSSAIVKDLTGQSKVPFAFPFSAENVEEDQLKKIVDRYYYLDILFDTKLKPEPNFMMGRISGESELPEHEDESNLPGYFKNLYLSEFLQKLRGR